MKLMKKEFAVIFSMIILAVASRLLPHPPNFAPITGIALFAASKLNKKILAFLLPLFCLFITDLILGLGWINLFVYGAFGMISLIGMRIQKGFPSNRNRVFIVIFYCIKPGGLVTLLSINS